MKSAAAFRAIVNSKPSRQVALPVVVSRRVMLDLPVDFDELTRVGSMMGSGAMIVMDEKNCMVDIAKYFVGFLMGELCGKCLPCREGVKRMHEILTRITEGNGKMEDIDLLEQIGTTLTETALCGLGQISPKPGDQYDWSISAMSMKLISKRSGVRRRSVKRLSLTTSVKNVPIAVYVSKLVLKELSLR